MAESVRCKRLRDRDYFDADYDVRFDPREQHICLFYQRMVIPHDECGVQCPGYTVEEVTQPSLTRTATPARRVVRRNPEISREAIRQEIDAVSDRIARHFTSEKALEREARLIVTQEQCEEFERRRRELDQQVTSQESELRLRRLQLAEQVVEAASETEILAISRTARVPLKWRLALTMPIEELIALHERLTSRRADGQTLREATGLLHAEVKQARNELVAVNVALSDASHALKIATDERRVLEMGQRRQTLEHIRQMLSTRTSQALQTCSDLLSESEATDLRRFLDVAASAIDAPPHELADIESRLRGMRLW